MRASDTWSLTFGVKDGLGWIDCVANGIGYGDIYLNPAGEHVIVGNYGGMYSPFSRNSRSEKLIIYGEAYVSSTIEANGGFKKTGADNNSVLLGGGGTKAISDFATSGHGHSGYLSIYGGSVSGKYTWTNGDATLKIYGADGGYGCGDETACIQTCFDGVDPETHQYVTNYKSRCFLSLQPRGGVVGIGLSSSSGYFTTADTKLIVNGDIRITGSILSGIPTLASSEIDAIIV